MKIRAALIVFFLLMAGFFVGQKLVYAQVPSASDSSSISASASESAATQATATQLANLQATYRNELTIYRSDEKTFQVAKDQYYQLLTLASLDEAVKQTRQVMLTRLDVLQAYFAIVRVTFANTKGIDPSVKTSLLANLDALVADLKTHQQQVSAATDRPSLLDVATKFSFLSPRILYLSDQISDLVTYGNLQTVFDKMSIIKHDFQTQFPQFITDPLLLAQKQRGLDEVQRNLDQINQPLVKIRTILNPANPNQNLNSANLSTDFSTIFGGLSRSESYLQELVKN